MFMKACTLTEDTGVSVEHYAGLFLRFSSLSVKHTAALTHVSCLEH